MRVTTSNSFPVEDITSKPRRYQSEVANEIGETSKEAEVVSAFKVPTTLESLINYFDGVTLGKQVLPTTPQDIKKLALMCSTLLRLSLKTPRILKDNSSEGQNEDKD